MLYNNTIFIRKLDLQDWNTVFSAMKSFTKLRNDTSYDELWLVEHFPIFTYGQSNKNNSILKIKNIPVVQSDRGGKITYHGPGQQLIYILVDIKRKKINIRQLVSSIEETIINTLSYFGIKSYSKNSAPGVYVNKKKFLLLD